MIPKVIHYCWFGGNEKDELVTKCIESWKKFCPDCEIIEWNESNFDVDINDYVNEAYSEKRWAFVSDFARLWIVYNYGGIYLDTDVEIIKNIDSVFNNDCFFCYEDDKYIATGLGFGSIKGNVVIKKLMDDYENIHFKLDNGKLDLLPCPQRNTKVLNEIDKSLYQVYSKEYFCPIDYLTKKINITNNTMAIHWYGQTWMTKKERKIRNFKNFIKRKFIKN